MLDQYFPHRFLWSLLLLRITAYDTFGDCDETSVVFFQYVLFTMRNVSLNEFSVYEIDTEIKCTLQRCVAGLVLRVFPQFASDTQAIEPNSRD